MNATSNNLLKEHVLLVPIHLDALVMSADQMAIEAMADFTRLPYTNGKRDFNAGTANISEEILSPPFGNYNLPLRAGVHLHWSLPEALAKIPSTKSVLNNITAENGCVKAPNRWLISKYEGTTVVNQVIVESDYLHPETEDAFQDYVNIY